MLFDQLFYNFFKRYDEEFKNLILKEKIFSQLNADDSINVGPNAIVHNHGSKDNIRLGKGVIIDGILECYTKGELIINDYTYIGRSRIFAAQKVEIGKGVLISDHVVIMDSDLHPLSAKKRFNDMRNWNKGVFPDVYTNIESRPVILGDYVWVSANSVILKGVTIGEGSIIGAGSIVTKDIPPYTIVAGNPAKIIREIPENER